jgi:hypothetical protein
MKTTPPHPLHHASFSLQKTTFPRHRLRTISSDKNTIPIPPHCKTTNKEEREEQEHLLIALSRRILKPDRLLKQSIKSSFSTLELELEKTVGVEKYTPTIL